ncbi:MAG TPA: (Fe-S)-binding protein [Terriglobales bacterium]|nr:(Fe-S)-binding protein [Terriglobales bacterium]
MPDPAILRYGGVPGYVYLWLLTVIAFFLFGTRVLSYVRVLVRARPEPRWDHVGQRIGLVITNVLGQRRLLDEPLIGLAHLIIFWSFVVYATTFFWSLIRGLIPTFAIQYPDEVPSVALLVQTLGILGVIALVVAAVRRYFFAPVSLERSRDATVILILIALVLLSSLAGSGFRALAAGEQSWHTPGGACAVLFASLGGNHVRAPMLYLGTWWLHMITVLGFLAYLPYSKHLHLLASPFGVFFASLNPGKLPAASEGAARLEEFTWRELFNGLACAECGRCDRACPNFLSGYSFSPKQLIHQVKEFVRAQSDSSASNSKRLLGDVLRPEDIWACTTCASCMERCPVFNEHIPLVIEMRRKLVCEGEVQPRLQEVFTNLTRYGNSFGQPPRARAKWAEGLNSKLKDSRKESAEYLWFVGDYASFDPRVQPVSRSFAHLLAHAGVDAGILYEGEQNSGTDVRRAGEEGLFEVLMQKNQASLAKAHAQKIVTTDPHSYHALKQEYRLCNGRNIASILHHTELLDDLIRTGKLSISKKLDLTATYHDPCYLGRYNGIYDPPRRVLSALGVKLLEMPRNRDKAYCCGAGGGRIWMEDPPGIKERPAENRLREAALLPGVKIIVVSCPKDLVMFQDALKTSGLQGKLSVKDIAELAEEAVAA